ncbi:hypothetical protein HW561_12470 [Rhodobacteraceae bacterium B1Z28]|uniref:Uncharacterized protein n=1 Tax=Ruegeria haliotis TaxID=2747601 RepID=A0ABX2PR33_9RHOB|nr:hypothetical protein [Ruegeria haliotis]NVO56604.1 hypothetical protein [Ruegeria haliotis]
MRFFVDTAEVNDIKDLIDFGLLDGALPGCSPDLTGLSAGHEHSDQYAAPEGVPLSS